MVHVGRNLPEDSYVVLDEAVEGRAPGGERHRVDEGDRAEVAPLQEVGPEGDRASEVVAHDGGLVQPPMVKELGEDPALGGQGDVLAFPLLRGAVTGEVEGVDGVRLSQGGDDLAPHVGGEGGAVDQHHRGTRPERLVAHRALRRSVLSAQRPSVHRLRSPLYRPRSSFILTLRLASTSAASAAACAASSRYRRTSHSG